MNRFLLLLVIFGCLVFHACSPGAKSTKSFDEIHRLVAGKTAGEVKKLWVRRIMSRSCCWATKGGSGGAIPTWPGELGPRGSQQGSPPRDHVKNPSSDQEGRPAEAKLEPRVSDPYGVGYLIPGSDESRASALNNHPQQRLDPF